jgi:hypothetical protein
LLHAKLLRWGRPLLFVGLAVVMLGVLFSIRRWAYGPELLLAGQIVAGTGVVILIAQVLIQKK